MPVDTQSLDVHLQYRPKSFLLPYQMGFAQKLNMGPDVQKSHCIFSTKPSRFLVINLVHLRRGEESELVMCMKKLVVCFTKSLMASDLYFYT